MYHKSVLYQECIDGLDIKPDGIFVDATFGGGGHSRGILENLNSEGKLFSFDQDPDALQNAIDDPRFTLINQNFKFLKNFLQLYKALPVDGILADLGVSSYQFDTPERGFSTRFDGRLDFRMNSNASLNGYDVVNTYTEEQLADVFFHYGELKNARRLASVIVNSRSEKKVETTFELKDIIRPLFPKMKENKFMALVFQALRIEVNQELDVLKDLLIQSTKVLKPGGRIAVITFHSLEDRLVKNFFKAGNFKGVPEKDFYGNVNCPFKLITRKPIVASAEELELNSRSRSAKLRIAEKK
ncbi:MAG: 16S rRNA (cytosine(1402)-N(4))-methyltransferase RsmH [Bacteroidales bacterium]